MIIDGHPVLVEYIDDEAEEDVPKKTEDWKSVRVREWQYVLQIVKCKDRTCCQPFRSSYLNIVKERFLPPPIAIIRNTANGMR